MRHGGTGRRTVGMALAAVVLSTATPASAGSIFTPVTVFPPNWATHPGHAQLYGWGAATMLDGSVLIGDYWNYRVQRVTLATDGSVAAVDPNFIHNPGFKPGQHRSPYGLGVDPVTGDIYMADTDRRGIDKYSATGAFITEWGTQGAGVNRFLYPSRVAVRSDGTVYVADTWANQIVVDQVAGTSVTELGTFGSFGTGPGCKMKQPHGMAWYYGADGTASIADDRLYVVDTNNKQIDVYGPNPMASGYGPGCNWLFSFGSGGAGPDRFKGDLRGLAIDQAHGWVYVVDGRGNRVRKFDLAGNFLLSFGKTAVDANSPRPGEFSDGGREVTVDANGNVWVGDMPDFRAQVFSPNGHYLFSTPGSYSPPGTAGFNGPRGVAIDANGNRFVTDTYNQRIVKYDAAGQFLMQWGSRGRDEYAFNYPRMLAIDPTDQSVVVADTDNHRIKKFTNSGQFVCEAGGLGSVGQLMRNPHGVDVGPDGKIYVTDTRNGLLKVFGPNCSFLFASTYPQGSAGGSLTYPRGIALDQGDGSVWVADSTLDIVKHYAVDLGAGTFTYLGAIGSKGSADDQWNNPFDLVVIGTTLIVADTASNKLKAWDTSTGRFLEAFGGGGTKLGRFLQPQGLDVSPADGTLWVCEQTNERIQQIAVTA